MAGHGRLSPEGIKAAKPRPRARNDRWLSDDVHERNSSRLLLRSAPNELIHFLLRYPDANGKRIAVSLGSFTAEPKPNALTLTQARAKADELRSIHKAPGSRDVRGYFKRQEKARVEAENLEAIRKEQERAAADATLR